MRGSVCGTCEGLCSNRRKFLTNLSLQPSSVVTLALSPTGQVWFGRRVLLFILGSSLGGVRLVRGLRGEEEGGGVRSGPGAVRTILLFHTISARSPKQPRMVRTFLKVHTRPRLAYTLRCRGDDHPFIVLTETKFSESSTNKQHHL